MVQDVYELVVEGHGGVPGLPQRALLLLRPVLGLEVPLTLFQEILAALDLHAEAAHVEEPDGVVELGRIVVPLPFVVGEARESAAVDFVKDVGFSPAHGVVPPVEREGDGMSLHDSFSLRFIRILRMQVARGGRSGPFGASGVGTGVRLEPVGAHSMTSCWNVYVDLSGPRPQPTGGQTRLTLASPGRPARWSPGEVMPRGWTRGQPAAINEGVLG